MRRNYELWDNKLNRNLQYIKIDVPDAFQSLKRNKLRGLKKRVKAIGTDTNNGR